VFHLRHPGIDSARPLVFAHRGGAALAPENTLTSFDRAFELGVDGFELDVRLSGDGIVIVHHDATCRRTMGISRNVEMFTADELSRMDTGHQFQVDGDYPFRDRGIGVPRFRDVLTRYPDAALIVELKLPCEELACAVVEEIKAANALDRVCIGAERMEGLHAVRAYEPRLATSAGKNEVRFWLYRSWVHLPVRNTCYRAFQVPEWSGWTKVVSPRFIRYAHQLGIPVQIFTVDVVEDMVRLLDWGVDAIITDRPDLAVRTIQAWTRNQEK
jgi:glycerophosphoryl diester phosphodiesterase